MENLEPKYYRQVLLGNNIEKYVDRQSEIFSLTKKLPRNYSISEGIILGILDEMSRILGQLRRYVKSSNAFNVSHVLHILAQINRGEGFSNAELYAPFNNIWLENHLVDGDVNARKNVAFFTLFLINEIRANKEEFVNQYAKKPFQEMFQPDKFNTIFAIAGMKNTQNNEIMFPATCAVAFMYKNKYITDEKHNLLFVSPDALLWKYQTTPYSDRLTSELLSDFTIFQRFCELINVKNIHIESMCYRPTTKRQQRLFGVINPTYKILTVSKPGKQHDVSGIAYPERKLPLHICRGHLARYTDEKPLFGKYSGTFFIPAHTRGDISVGAVVKDYKVVAAKK